MTWIFGAIQFVRESRAAQLVLAVLLLAAIGVTIYLWAISQNRVVVERSIDGGRAMQQRDDLQETIKRTEEANVAAQKVRTDPAARRDSCLRHSRTPENC